jgi:hypothetical protein
MKQNIATRSVGPNRPLLAVTDPSNESIPAILHDRYR